MTLDIFFALIAFIYLYLISTKKNFRKLRLFLSKPLNVLLILILILILYNYNDNLGVLLFILLLFSKQITIV